MVQREGALLHGMWEPPAVDGEGAGAGRKLRAEVRRLGMDATLAKTEERISHRITHRAFDVEIWTGKVETSRNHQAVRFVDPERPGVPLTGLARRLARLKARLVPAKIVR